MNMNTVLEFRQALALTNNDYPFSVLFGPAGTREDCVQSSQKVYTHLLLRQPERARVLDFDTIALVVAADNGNVDWATMKELIQLFRPDRDGTLTEIDFIKSIDAIYKRLRLLSASIAHSRQVDHTFEQIFNWAFYTIFFVIMLSVLGYDPMALTVCVTFKHDCCIRVHDRKRICQVL